jgi:hypothetical protein
MNSFCIDINLDISPLRDEIDINSFPKEYWNTIPISDINPKLIIFLMRHGLGLPKAATFYSEGEIVHPIHIDGASVSDMVKINWAYGDNHTMNWYSTAINKQASTENIDRTYIYYKSSEVKLIHSQKVDCPSLVQVGVPHNVINYSGSRRCISVALFHIHTNQHVTMQEALTLFSKIID